MAVFVRLSTLLFLLGFNLYSYALSGHTIMIYNQTSLDVILNFFDSNCMYTGSSGQGGVSMDSLNGTILKANHSVKVYEESKGSGGCFFIGIDSSEYKLKASLSVAPYIYTVMKGEAYGSAISRYMEYYAKGGSIEKFKFSFNGHNIYIKH